MVNTLQKKLAQLKHEKVDLENQLEAEQEYIVHKLQKNVRARLYFTSLSHRPNPCTWALSI